MVTAVPDPPDPFNPAITTIEPGTPLMRVFRSDHQDRSVVTFNPGFGPPTRFAFFSTGAGPDSTVPVLYAAETEGAAIAESLLHDVPKAGGRIRPNGYYGRSLGSFAVVRELRLASFRGLGLRQLGIVATELTDTPVSSYQRTVAWAAAAHRLGLDGVMWTSSKCNDAYAVMLFGDRVHHDDLYVIPGGRSFMDPIHVDWLAALCAPMNIEVRR